MVVIMGYIATLEEYPYELVCKEVYWDKGEQVTQEAGCGAAILYFKTMAPGAHVGVGNCTWPDRPSKMGEEIKCPKCGSSPTMTSTNFRKRKP